MGTTLHTLAPNPGATKTKKRLGRGRGSGTGKTSGKGVKGQKARSGHHGARFAFEGGQIPFNRRVPKRGFKNPNRVPSFAINLGTLERTFEAGAVVDMSTLRAIGLLPKNAVNIKILSEGDLTKKFTVHAHAFSAAAKEKLEKLGGTVTVLASVGKAAAAPSASASTDA